MKIPEHFPIHINYRDRERECVQGAIGHMLMSLLKDTDTTENILIVIEVQSMWLLYQLALIRPWTYRDLILCIHCIFDCYGIGIAESWDTLEGYVVSGALGFRRSLGTGYAGKYRIACIYII